MLAACNRSREEPRVPLGQATTQAAADSGNALPPNHPPIGDRGGNAPMVTGAARVALDSGNAAFRAKNYDAALRQYRLAAAAAPDNPAPQFGIQMAARALGNRALADSAMRRIRELSPQAAPADSVHAKLGQPAKPPRTR